MDSFLKDQQQRMRGFVFPQHQPTRVCSGSKIGKCIRAAQRPILQDSLMQEECLCGTVSECQADAWLIGFNLHKRRKQALANKHVAFTEAHSGGFADPVHACHFVRGILCGGFRA